jgi:hypothetical protein
MWRGTESNNTELIHMVEFIYREEEKVTLQNWLHMVKFICGMKQTVTIQNWYTWWSSCIGRKRK